jgi:hypothetical protein
MSATAIYELSCHVPSHTLMGETGVFDFAGIF